MKRSIVFLVLYLVLYLTNAYAQTFVESECGIISNPSYSLDNYQTSSWGLGFRLYHGTVVIASAEGSQSGRGYQGVLLKFVNDTIGYFIYSSRFSVATSYHVNKIIGNKIIHLCEVYNLFNLHIVNAELAYLITYTMNFELLKLTDGQPVKRLLYGKPTLSAAITDTIVGRPLCQNQSELNIRYDTINYKIVFYSPSSTNSINEHNISEWNIFPNPADDYIHFRTNASSVAYVIKIFDGLGILQKTITSKRDFETAVYVGDLKAGAYLIETHQGRKKYLNKLIKK